MRRARLHVPGAVHHLIWRCLNHEWLIKTKQQRQRYLHWLGRALDDSDWKCIAYAVMSNHIHLAVVAGNAQLASWSRRANTPFALWMNEQSNRLGPFFANRAHDYALREIGAYSTIGYIHNNPVRAGLVARARDSDWTSHRAYLGLIPPPSWLHVGEGMHWAQTPNVDAFEDYVNSDPRPPERPAGERISKTVRNRGQINDGTPTGNVVPLVVRPFARVRPDPRLVIAHVGQMLDVDPRVIASRLRVGLTARRVVVHASAMLGLTGSDIAAALGISPPSSVPDSAYNHMSAWDLRTVCSAVGVGRSPLVSVACVTVDRPSKRPTFSNGWRHTCKTVDRP